MQKGEEASSTMNPWSLFLYGMKAPMTREKYRGRLVKFFNFLGLTIFQTMSKSRYWLDLKKKVAKEEDGYCDNKSIS